jgi:hypothetical protein
MKVKLFDVSFDLRWELTYISEHVHTDQVGVYRLTQQSIQFAIANGRTLETCIQFLTFHSYYGLPDSVRAALEQWANAASQNSYTPKSLQTDRPEALLASSNRESGTFVRYEFVSEFPKRNDIYPSWQSIPIHWWKECRAYHASTRKEIVQMAIEWQALLKLRNQDEEWILVPKQVQENETGWSLTGWVHSRLLTFSQDQWQAIQLILPGFEEG